MLEENLEILEKSKCVRCGKPSKSGSKGGRCSACLKKLRKRRNKPGDSYHLQMKADTYIRADKGKSPTSTVPKKSTGNRAAIIKKLKSAYKRYGTNQKLSLNRKDNSHGHTTSNTHATAQKLNRGRHNIDKKKHAKWLESVKKSELTFDELKLLLLAKANELNDLDLIKSVEDLTQEDFQDTLQ